MADSVSSRSELCSFLYKLNTDPTDYTSRFEFSDWLDVNFKNEKLERRLPKGFRSFWPWSPLSSRRQFITGRQWTNGDISMALESVKLPASSKLTYWFDHARATQTCGLPVLIAEPYRQPGQSLQELHETAVFLQNAIGCPVSFSFKAAHFHECSRFTVWHLGRRF